MDKQAEIRGRLEELGFEVKDQAGRLAVWFRKPHIDVEILFSESKALVCRSREDAIPVVVKLDAANSADLAVQAVLDRFLRDFQKRKGSLQKQIVVLDSSIEKLSKLRVRRK